MRLIKGQVWCDGDPRRREREIEIVRVPRSQPDSVIVQDRRTGRQRTVSRERFNGTRRGYRFIR